MIRFAILWSFVLGAFLVSCEQPQSASPTAGQATAAGEQEEGQASAGEPVSPGRTRGFRFHYRFAVTDLELGQQVRVWLPVPPSSEYQQITPLTTELPAEPTFHSEPKYGNRILYLEAEVGEEGRLEFDVPYRVERREVRALSAPESTDSPESAEQPGGAELALFLEPNSEVPIDGKPLELLSSVSLSDEPLTRARQIYEVVDAHVTYNKEGTGWGNGDVLWVCDSGQGNCTDFHSLFISLARAEGLPSRFEIGFPIPTEAAAGPVGGYHCWAFFFVTGRGWVPVDISEADKDPSLKDYYFGSLTPDRVAFSTGRDIELVPEAPGGPLNFFIYPHVVVGEEVLPREQIELEFSYEDLASEPAGE